MSGREGDLRTKKREMEQKLSEAVAEFERETNLSVVEVILTPSSGGSQGSVVKTRVELRS